MKLPADYVAEHVELGYAQTSHAAQGRTVDRSILLLDGPTDSRGIYVPMTRGRHHNDAYIVTNGEDTALDIFGASIASDWIDRPALARQAELASINRHRPGTLPAHELQTLLGQQAQLTATLTQLRTDLTHLPGNHSRAAERRERAQAELANTRGRLHDATDPLAQFDRPFHRRGHEAEIRNAHHTVETLPEHIRSQTATVADLSNQQHDIDKRLTRAENLDNRRPAMETQLADVGDRLGEDRRNRSRGVRPDPPGRVIDTLGRRPHEAKHEKPPEPDWRETLSSLAEYGRKKKARDQFEPWTVSCEDGSFEDDEVVVQTRLFLDAWQRKQWGRLVPLMPSQLIGKKRMGEAAEFAKSWFDTHDINDVEIARVEYTRSSVAEIRGSATIDGTAGNLRLRWVYYDPEGNLALNAEDGSWQLAVVAPHTYLVDENGERLD